MARYIDFLDEGQSRSSGRTRTWVITPKDEAKAIGRIAWFGRWRRYALYPFTDTVWEQTCLRDVAEFCESQTKILRDEWKTRRALDAQSVGR